MQNRRLKTAGIILLLIAVTAAFTACDHQEPVDLEGDFEVNIEGVDDVDHAEEFTLEVEHEGDPYREEELDEDNFIDGTVIAVFDDIVGEAEVTLTIDNENIDDGFYGEDELSEESEEDEDEVEFELEFTEYEAELSLEIEADDIPDDEEKEQEESLDEDLEVILEETEGEETENLEITLTIIDPTGEEIFSETKSSDDDIDELEDEEEEYEFAVDIDLDKGGEYEVEAKAEADNAAGVESSETFEVEAVRPQLAISDFAHELPDGEEPGVELEDVNIEVAEVADLETEDLEVSLEIENPDGDDIYSKTQDDLDEIEGDSTTIEFEINTTLDQEGTYEARASAEGDEAEEVEKDHSFLIDALEVDPDHEVETMSELMLAVHEYDGEEENIIAVTDDIEFYDWEEVKSELADEGFEDIENIELTTDVTIALEENTLYDGEAEEARFVLGGERTEIINGTLKPANNDLTIYEEAKNAEFTQIDINDEGYGSTVEIEGDDTRFSDVTFTSVEEINVEEDTVFSEVNIESGDLTASDGDIRLEGELEIEDDEILIDEDRKLFAPPGLETAKGNGSIKFAENARAESVILDLEIKPLEEDVTFAEHVVLKQGVDPLYVEEDTLNLEGELELREDVRMEFIDADLAGDEGRLTGEGFAYFRNSESEDVDFSLDLAVDESSIFTAAGFTGSEIELAADLELEDEVDFREEVKITGENEPELDGDGIEADARGAEIEFAGSGLEVSGLEFDGTAAENYSLEFTDSIEFTGGGWTSRGTVNVDEDATLEFADSPDNQEAIYLTEGAGLLNVDALEKEIDIAVEETNEKSLYFEQENFRQSLPEEEITVELADSKEGNLDHYRVEISDLPGDAGEDDALEVEIAGEEEDRTGELTVSVEETDEEESVLTGDSLDLTLYHSDIAQESDEDEKIELEVEVELDEDDGEGVVDGIEE